MSPVGSRWAPIQAVRATRGSTNVMLSCAGETRTSTFQATLRDAKLALGRLATFAECREAS